MERGVAGQLLTIFMPFQTISTKFPRAEVLKICETTAPYHSPVPPAQLTREDKNDKIRRTPSYGMWRHTDVSEERVTNRQPSG
jgi:hypothetical protein